MPTGKLYVTVNECKDLNDTELFGKMDPYVKLWVDDCDKLKTKVADNGHKTPKFNQSFVFNMEGKEKMFHILVLDHENLGSDKNIGRFDCEITKLTANGQPKFYELVDVSNFRKIAGQISLTVKFEGSGWPVDASAAQAQQPQQQQQPAAAVQVQQPQVQQPQVQQVQQPQYVPQQQPVQQVPQPVVYAQPQPVIYQQPRPAVVYQQPAPVIYQQPAPVVMAPQVVYGQPMQPMAQPVHYVPAQPYAQQPQYYGPR